MTHNLLNPAQLSKLNAEEHITHYRELYRLYEGVIAENNQLRNQNNRKRKANSRRTGQRSLGGRLRHSSQEPEIEHLINECWRLAHENMQLPTGSKLIEVMKEWRAIHEPALILSPHDLARRRIKDSTITKWRTSFTDAWDHEKDNFERFYACARHFHTPRTRDFPV